MNDNNDNNDNNEMEETISDYRDSFWEAVQAVKKASQDTRYHAVRVTAGQWVGVMAITEGDICVRAADHPSKQLWWFEWRPDGLRATDHNDDTLAGYDALRVLENAVETSSTEVDPVMHRNTPFGGFQGGDD